MTCRVTLPARAEYVSEGEPSSHRSCLKLVHCEYEYCMLAAPKRFGNGLPRVPLVSRALLVKMSSPSAGATACVRMLPELTRVCVVLQSRVCTCASVLGGAPARQTRFAVGGRANLPKLSSHGAPAEGEQ